MIAGNFRIGIIDFGYFGLPLAPRFAQIGLPILGFDIDLEKLQAIEERRSYIRHVGGQAARHGGSAKTVVRA